MVLNAISANIPIVGNKLISSGKYYTSFVGYIFRYFAVVHRRKQKNFGEVMELPVEIMEFVAVFNKLLFPVLA